MALENLNSSPTWNSSTVAPPFNPSTTPPVAETSLAPTTATNPTAEPNKAVSNGKLALALSALTLGVVGVGGFFLHRYLNAGEALKQSEHLTREVSKSLEKPFTQSSLNTEAYLREVQQVMIPGNSGNSCHTMATLNSLRLYLAKTQDVPPEVRRRMESILKGSPEEAKDRIFTFLRTAFPNEFGRYLQDNGTFSGGSPGQSRLIHGFITEYAFDRPVQSVYQAYEATNVDDMKKVLFDLRAGKIGVLSHSDNSLQKAHIGSLVGVQEESEGLIQDYLSGRTLSDQEMKQIKLLMYNQQDTQNPLTHIDLHTIMKPRQSEWVTINIFDHNPSTYNNSLQNTFYRQNVFSVDYLSPQFHQHLMDVGNRILGVNS